MSFVDADAVVQGLHNDSSLGLAVSWEALFLFDLLIFALTLFKTYRAQILRDIASGRSSTMFVFLRDGESLTTSVATMLTLNFFTGAVYFVCVPFSRAAVDTRVDMD